MSNTFLPDGPTADAGDGAAALPRMPGGGAVRPALATPSVADGIAQVAGVADGATAQTLTSATRVAGAAGAVASGAGSAQALAGAGLQAAALVDSRVGQAARVAQAAAPLARSALEALNLSSARADLDTPGIDDNPLTGRALSDFASPPPMRQFVPALADGGESASLPATLASAFVMDENNRLLRLQIALPPDKRLAIASIEGSAGLSEVGGYQLRLLSDHQAVDHKDVLGKNVTVGILLADGSEASINGYVSRFGYTGTDGALAAYDAEVVPWLWFLGKRVNSRIFQQVTAQDVLDRVFGEYGALADFEFRLFGPLPEETYLVQYGESDLDFVSRVMERFGLLYYFEHRADGHTLVVTDDSTHPQGCPEQAMHPLVRYRSQGHTRAQDDLISLTSMRELQPSAVALSTYDYKQPGDARYVEQVTVAEQGDIPRLEVYDGNPAYAYRDHEQGQREAQRRLEVFEWQAKRFYAKTQCRAMTVGHTFQIAEHPALSGNDPEDSQFVVVGMRLSARNNHVGQRAEAGEQSAYENQLTLIRRKIPYRPAQRHPKPVMRGPQTATVVGPKGQEIHTDDFGRIKVQFPWDREGRNDQGSSCWIRVSQPWAGKGWGTLAIPRIGQEVVVDFIEGDPDRPLATGRLFNATQRAPTGLPDAAHVMGFVSRSTPGGGGFCEMTIHDRKGEELVNIHSQKDMCTTVQNNMTTVVNGPAQTTVVSEGCQSTTVKQSIEMTSVEDTMTLTAKQQVKTESQEADILLKGKTMVRLEAGSSSLELREDGTILLNGVLVKIVGTSSIDLNPDPMSNLADDATPEEVNAWWNALTPDEQASVMQMHPDRIGAMNGIPSAVRDEINRERLPVMRQDLQNQIDGLRAEYDALPPAPPPSQYDRHDAQRARLEKQMAELEGKRDGLDAIQNRLDMTAGETDPMKRHYLLDVDTEGNGRAIVAKGNPDFATNTSTYVPGTFSTLASVEGDLERGDRMHRAATRAGSESPSSITWAGYDAPQSIVPQAMRGKYAENAKGDLASFQQGLRATHTGDQPSLNTVVGHS